MKNVLISATVLFVTLIQPAFAQRSAIQYFRPYDQRGLNIYETTKADTIGYDGVALRIGANFTQGFQTLSHSNSSGVPLYELGNGFPLAQANLNIDAQLLDGVRVSLISYMASHHHNEFWVKGGYLQIDKVGFLNSEWLDKLWTNLTLKLGHMEINYGDAHFRRSDGGNTFLNPFMENNIMDEFATEIGGELYWQRKGMIAMVGVTNGEIQGNVKKGNSSPSIYAKLGFDKTVEGVGRFRLTGSILSKSSSIIKSTLFNGDRTGSNYQFALEPAAATVAGNAFSGRFNPNFTDNVTALMINPFVKVGGFEFFGTIEFARGNTFVENGEVQYADGSGGPVFAPQSDRSVRQFAADALYRFGHREQFYIGARFNTVSGEQVFGASTTTTNAEIAYQPATPAISQGARADITINRMAAAAGWFISRNILVKAEYVNQEYNDYPVGNILEGGEFSGFVVQGSIAF